MDRTPTETLMDCLEDFGRSEPHNVIVIYSNAEGDLNWSRSSELNLSTAVGMLDCVKTVLLESFKENKNDQK